MKKRLSIGNWIAAGLAGVIVIGLLPGPAESHHSFAMYDRNKSVTLTGKLTRFIPGSNHAQLIFEVIGPEGEPELDGNGEPLVWGFETGPAASIAREGVTVKGFPRGTILTVTLSPLRDGGPFGTLAPNAAIIRCGNALPEGGCTEQTGEMFLGPPD